MSTLIPISFFDTNIAIRAQSATDSKHIGTPVTVSSFSQGEEVSLYRVEESGDLLLRTTSGRFIEGPEA
ncbi:hypothetical protein A3709_20530 [Halioglobus sp. HI00S01]|uniref:hypothetical protein n=1 Tax=Halioglobus sp. HI00S01 TaxID=1822214 RepID=UPI0007C3E30D|nr:hypothetical protein [Halioglobus sp. HI00S01]KZX58000.1 hypothetical protein A3709_20530 [Halioglobus sp. HI00S01]